MQLLLYNKEFTELLENFYTLTGIRVVLFDENYTELVSYPADKTTFCNTMKKIPSFCQKCATSDKNSFEKAKTTRKLAIFTCHAGLTEATVPIMEKDKIIGYLMFGQITNEKNKDAFFQHMKELCSSYKTNINVDELIKKIKYRNKKQIEAASKILDAFTNYVQYKEMVYLSKKRFIDSVEEYIDRHMSENITVEDLCIEFGISRRSLYDKMNQYVSGGVAAFIRQKKLNHAKHLLSTTNMSITDIADVSGFSDYNYFLRLFKHNFGISPKQFSKSKPVQ
jgi:AraC-like DNA-binding protein